MDEFERLYTLHPYNGEEARCMPRHEAWRQHEITRNATLSFDFLYDAADTLVRRGRFGAILTGSSTTFPQLIDLSASRLPSEFKKEFHFLSEAKNLNGSRYRSEWVRPKFSALRSDTDEILRQMAKSKADVGKVLDEMKSTKGDEEFDAFVSALTAKTMGNARAIETELNHLLSQRKTSYTRINTGLATIMERMMTRFRDKQPSDLRFEKMFTTENHPKLSPLTEGEVEECIADDARRNEIFNKLEDEGLVTRVSTDGEDAFMVTDLTRWSVPGSPEWPITKRIRQAFNLFEEVRATVDIGLNGLSGGGSIKTRKQ